MPLYSLLPLVLFVATLLIGALSIMSPGQSASAQAATAAARKLDVPYVSKQQEAVNKILDLGKVGLKVCTGVVSHDFDMGPEWPPEKVEKAGCKTVHY